MCGLLLHVEEIWALWFLCTANQAWKKKIQPSSRCLVSQSSVPCGTLKVTNPLIKLCVHRIRCCGRSYPFMCLFGITGIIWSVFWMRGRALSPVDLLFHLPPLQTAANTHQSQRATRTLTTVRLTITTVFSHMIIQKTVQYADFSYNIFLLLSVLKTVVLLIFLWKRFHFNLRCPFYLTDLLYG